MKALRTKAFICAAALALAGTAAYFPAAPVSAATVQEQTGVYNGMKYEIMGSYCLITGYTDALPEELVIPEKIDGYNVEWVHMQAFENCTKLKSVTLPKTIQVLNMSCFKGCTSLETVIFPEEMKSLRSVIYDAFDDTPWLEAQRKKTPLIILGKILFDAKGSTGDIVIPEGVTQINDYAFARNKEITSVKFPSTLEEIESHAFEGCTGLKSVTIPGTVDTVEDNAFSKCTGLETLTMESGVSKLDGSAFYGCTALKTINFSDTLLFLSGGGFYGVFQGCDSLEEIVLPASLRTISEAFTACANLKSVTFQNYYTEFQNGKAVISNVGGGFFADDEELNYTGVIRGYSGSSAQTYAETYGYRFESIGDYPTSGNCGGNTTWSVENDTLTIAGSGDLENYMSPMKFDDKYSYQGVAPWFYYHDSIKHIVIGKDVTGLASGLCAWMSSLETITVLNPSLSVYSLAVIRKKDKDGNPVDYLIRGYADSTAQDYAEKNDFRFEALEGDPGEIPAAETVKTGSCGEKLTWKLDTKAGTLDISGTGDMTDFEAENTTTPWISEGFAGGIGTVSIAEGVTSIGSIAFAACCRVEEISVPKSVKQIGRGAFELMGDLKTLTILNPDCEIPDDASTVCSGIKANEPFFTGKIRGYAGSTAEAYAKKYGYTFEALQEESLTTTVTTSTTAKPTTTVSTSTTANPTTTVSTSTTANPTTTVSTSTTATPTTTVSTSTTAKPTTTVSTSTTAKPTTTVSTSTTAKPTTTFTTVLTTTITTTVTQLHVDYAPKVTWDDSPMHVGETRRIHVEDPYLRTTVKSAGIYCTEDVFTYEFDAEKSDLVITAVKPCEKQSFTVNADKCAFTTQLFLTILPAESTEIMTGDIKGDGAVSAEDAQLALLAYVQTMAGMESGLTEQQTKAADVNGDKAVTVEDAQLILLYYTENFVAKKAVTWTELIESLKK